MNVRVIIVWAVVILTLGWVNLLVVQHERLVMQGRPVILELTPVDPRSLIQGDYMALRYRAARDAAHTLADPPDSGALVIALDERNIGHFQRFHDDSQPLAANEVVLRYHTRNGQILLGAESFFFQEGQAEAYEQARYGELRVAENGQSLLSRLLDADLRPIEPE